MQYQYSFQDHIHNYAVWTSARAVQRKFTKTKNIKAAIEKSDLRTFSEDRICADLASFEVFHRRCASQLLSAFAELNVPNATYGKAAKIIAIYLKTVVIIPSLGQDNLSKWIHPPIDRILLKNLSKQKSIKALRTINWTDLDESEYWNLCKQIKQEGLALDWTLEEFWHPEQELLTSEL